MKFLRWLLEQPFVLIPLFILYLYVCSQTWQAVVG